MFVQSDDGGALLPAAFSCPRSEATMILCRFFFERAAAERLDSVSSEVHWATHLWSGIDRCGKVGG